MGSGQSARKLTISNEEEVGVIKVSNAIIQRLAQGDRTGTGESTADADTGTSTSPSPSPTPPLPPPPPPPPPSATPVAPPTPGVATPGYPTVFYYPELTMSAHHMQQQKEKELRQQDEYWRKRLQHLDESYQRINRVLEEEYKKAANETAVAKPGQRTPDIQRSMQPCLENSNKVLKCYQDHPKETLKCSDLVQEFSNCVWNVHYTRVIEARS